MAIPTLFYKLTDWIEDNIMGIDPGSVVTWCDDKAPVFQNLVD